MRSILKVGITVAAVVIVVAALRATVLRPKPVAVEVAQVERGTVQETITNSQAGTVKSHRRARIGAERTARILAIENREGARVEAGEVLIRLDESTARDQLELARRDRDAAQARLAAAQAGLQLAESRRARAEELAASRSISRERLDEARAAHESAQAEVELARSQVARAKAALALAEDELRHMRVEAPFGGVVTQLFAELGESAIPGQPLLELLDRER